MPYDVQALAVEARTAPARSEGTNMLLLQVDVGGIYTRVECIQRRKGSCDLEQEIPDYLG
jgi:hypothetical protein